MKYSLNELYNFWESLSAVPINDDGKINEPFLHFPKKTHREEIWTWFESQNPEFSAHEAMYGGAIAQRTPLIDAVELTRRYALSELTQIDAVQSLAKEIFDSDQIDSVLDVTNPFYAHNVLTSEPVESLLLDMIQDALDEGRSETADRLIDLVCKAQIPLADQITSQRTVFHQKNT